MNAMRIYAMHPMMLPWVAGWCLYWSMLLPPAERRPAEVVDLAQWRRAHGRG